MNRKLKKYMAVGLSVFMLMTTVSANTKLLGTQNVSAAINSSIGSGLSWKLSNGNKTLTISGTGTMDDFKSASAVPWRGSASVITKVVFSDGLENIGDNAFAYCTSLKMISIPNTIKKIGKNAFYNSGLEMADFNMKDQKS